MNSETMLPAKDLPMVQFYVPRDPVYSDIPSDPSAIWSWVCSTPGMQTGRTIWTIYTCLILQQAGFNCRIVRELPREGIVAAHRDFLPATLIPRGNIFVLCLKPDRKQHSWAHMHVIQNDNDPLVREKLNQITPCLPYWPQPSMIPREKGRGAIVQNIAYLGRTTNLDPSLRGANWIQALRDMGKTWLNKSLPQWHDYSDVDLTVSVRRFGDAHVVSSPVNSSESKPPSKLVNSWLAGVPAIVGDESAYRSVKKTELDFIVTRSKEELLQAIRRIAGDPVRYADMVANGRERSREYHTEAIKDRWIRMFEDDVAPAYRKWLMQPRRQRSLAAWSNYLAYWFRSENIRTAWHGISRE
jgi:hypothetical protein